MKTYSIPEDNLEALKEKIEALSRKAVKLGLSPISFEILGHHLVEIKSEDSAYMVYEVKIEGQSPIIAGWQFVGKIEPINGQNVVQAYEELPTQYRTVDMTCEHCHINRYRTATYILKNEQGQYKQVGSTCLKDFTGHPNVMAMADYAQALREIEMVCSNPDDADFLGDAGKNPQYIKLERFIGYTLCFVEEHGFVSRQKAGYGQAATADLVLDAMFPRNGELRLFLEKKYTDKAKVVINWIRESFSVKPSQTDYEHNMILICSDDYIMWKHAGYAASLVPLYNRENETKISSGSFVGQVGEKITVKVTCTMTKVIEGQFTSTLHKFVDAQNNLYVWFASNVHLTQGETYTLTGTIKKHDTFNQEKQNTLTRCKVM